MNIKAINCNTKRTYPQVTNNPRATAPKDISFRGSAATLKEVILESIDKAIKAERKDGLLCEIEGVNTFLAGIKKATLSVSKIKHLELNYEGLRSGQRGIKALGPLDILNTQNRTKLAEEIKEELAQQSSDYYFCH